MAFTRKTSSDRLVVQNAAKTLLANIRFASVDDPIRTIMMTSTIPNEGKTTVSKNLAIAIASGGKRVLLVECDMRRRSMADELGVRAQSGIYAVLSRQVDLDEAVVSTSQPNLYFLDAEPHIPNPADILASSRFRKLVESMRDDFDYVIFDTPPVGAFVDAAIVGALVDASILVVRNNFVKRQELLDAVDQLKRADVRLIGTVLNRVEQESSEYYYAYYNKDGKRVKKSANHHEQRSAPIAPPAPRQSGVAPMVSAAGHGSGFKTSSRFSRS